MATKTKPGTFSRIVDVDAGAVSREIFVNEDIYQQEQEQVFAQAWLFVGHESQITKPGDYFVSSMGEESVILCRDRQSEIHVFLNSCAHRRTPIGPKSMAIWRVIPTTADLPAS